MTYYDILEVIPSASDEIIKSAYKALSKKHHPDIYQGDPNFANKRMAMINEAYEVLSDPAKRKRYDESFINEHEKVVTDILFAGDTIKHQPSQQSSGHNGCSGYLSNIIGVIFWIVVIAFAVRACSGGDEDIHDGSQEQTTQTQVQESTYNTEQNSELSEAANNIEMLFFHKPYTDLGSVEIHEFSERDTILEYIVSIGSDRETLADGCYLSLENKLFGNDYYYATVATTQYYYVGKLKENKPHGLGAIVGFSEGEGTYELKGEMIFYYVGEFKNGMKHGFGVEFNADECDITWAFQDLCESGIIEEKIMSIYATTCLIISRMRDIGKKISITGKVIYLISQNLKDNITFMLTTKTR